MHIHIYVYYRRLLGLADPKSGPKAISDIYKHIPTWMEFRYFDNAVFLNKILDALWPNIDRAVAGIVRGIAEPLLDSSRPPMITTMEFTSFSLGQVAPMISGIKVQKMEEGKGKIVIEICDLELNMKPDITFKLAIAGMPLYIKFDSLTIIAKVRIELANLMDEIPCFSKLGVSFLEPPTIDYRVGPAFGNSSDFNIKDIPGLSGWLDQIVQDILQGLMIYPVQIEVPIAEDANRGPIGLLHFNVARAEIVVKEKKNKVSGFLKDVQNMGDKPDYFVEIEFLPSGKKTTSEVAWNQVNPVFNFSSDLMISNFDSERIRVKLFYTQVKIVYMKRAVRIPTHDSLVLL